MGRDGDNVYSARGRQAVNAAESMKQAEINLYGRTFEQARSVLIAHDYKVRRNPANYREYVVTSRNTPWLNEIMFKEHILELADYLEPVVKEQAA